VTLIEGDDVRTGVTVVIPQDGRESLFAGAHRLNGNGELTGLEWVRESGCLTTPIGLANTHGVVGRDAILARL
jgi:D-aminopeptidase